MDAVNLVKKAYDIGCCARAWIKCCGCCCEKKSKALKKKHFFKKWITIDDACQPDNIIWAHLGYSSGTRNFMAALNWTIAIILMVASLLGMVYFKVKTDELKGDFSNDYVCPKDSLSDDFKLMTYNDQIKDNDERLGLLHCFCAASASKDPKNILSVNFSEFTDDLQNEKPELYCTSWVKNQII